VGGRQPGALSLGVGFEPQAAIMHRRVTEKRQVGSIALCDLLEVENDDFFTACVCPSTGVLVWPAIRNSFYRLIMSDWFYAAQPLVDTARKITVFNVGRVAMRAVWHNVTHPPRCSFVLIHATGAGLFTHTDLSRNRFTHYFSEALGGDTWSIEGLFNYEWPLPRDGGRLSFSLPATAKGALYSRVAVPSSIRRIAEEIVERATHRAKRLLGWKLGDARKKWLNNLCARQVTGYPLQKKWLMRWMEKVTPRLMLIEDGCYGRMAVLNHTARACGVVVAEFQHGMVTGGHDVYNVASALERSEAYARTLPEYFLAYGPWWNRQFNAPTQKVVIGNPHRAASLERQVFGKEKELGVILVLGDGIETNFYLEFCRELGNLVSPEYTIVFRPHPLERSRVSAPPAGGARRIQIDQDPEIYASFAKADVVVAELSTGLFEAVGLTQRIFVWNTAKSRFGLPNHPFASFDRVTDLAQMIKEHKDSGIVSGMAPEEIWASDWQGRFRGFIDSVCERGRPGKVKTSPGCYA
jgi:hypothetical protein